MAGYLGQVQHTYTAEQVAWLRATVPGRPWAAVAVLFNQRFGTDVREKNLWMACKRRGIANVLNSRFKPGDRPWNTGRRGVNGTSPTQFQPGHKPHNHLPVGTMRNNEGRLEIKVAEPHRWRSLAAVRWEEHHNRFVPPGHVVLFADQDARNFAPDNLVCVSRAELAVLNKRKLVYAGAGPCTRVGVEIARVVLAAGRRRAAGPQKISPTA